MGYGHINPNGLLTIVLAAAEAPTGLLGFAIAAKLFYKRCRKPSIL